MCESLDEVTSFKGPLTQATIKEAVKEATAAGSDDDGCDAWSLEACVDKVIALRDVDEVTDASRLVLSALATTVHLPGRVRLEAMKLANEGQASRLVDFVAGALEEEGKVRLAKKALSGLSLG